MQSTQDDGSDQERIISTDSGEDFPRETERKALDGEILEARDRIDCVLERNRVMAYREGWYDCFAIVILLAVSIWLIGMSCSRLADLFFHASK